MTEALGFLKRRFSVIPRESPSRRRKRPMQQVPSKGGTTEESWAVAEADRRPGFLVAPALLSLVEGLGMTMAYAA